jgi:hypothetical protein
MPNVPRAILAESAGDGSMSVVNSKATVAANIVGTAGKARSSIGSIKEPGDQL